MSHPISTVSPRTHPSAVLINSHDDDEDEYDEYTASGTDDEYNQQEFTHGSSHASDDEFQQHQHNYTVDNNKQSYRSALLSHVQHSVNNSSDEENDNDDNNQQQIQLSNADDKLQQIRTASHEVYIPQPLEQSTPPKQSIQSTHNTDTQSNKNHINGSPEQDIDIDNSDIHEEYDDIDVNHDITYNNMSTFNHSNPFSDADRHDDIADHEQFESPTRVLAHESMLMGGKDISNVDQTFDSCSHDQHDNTQHTHDNMTQQQEQYNTDLPDATPHKQQHYPDSSPYTELQHQFDSPGLMFASKSGPLGTLGNLGHTQRPVFYSPNNNHTNNDVDLSQMNGDDAIEAHEIISPIRTAGVRLLSDSVDVTDNTEYPSIHDGTADISYNVNTNNSSVPATPSIPVNVSSAANTQHTSVLQTPPFNVAVSQSHNNTYIDLSTNQVNDASGIHQHQDTHSNTSDHDDQLPEVDLHYTTNDVSEHSIVDSIDESINESAAPLTYPSSHMGLTATVDNELATINNITHHTAISDTTDQSIQRPAAHTFDNIFNHNNINDARVINNKTVANENIKPITNDSYNKSRVLTSTQLRKLHRFIHFQLNADTVNKTHVSDQLDNQVQTCIDKYIDVYTQHTHNTPVYQSVKQTSVSTDLHAYTVMLIYNIPSDTNENADVTDWKLLFTITADNQFVNTRFIELKPATN